MIIDKGNQEKAKETDANTETVRRFPLTRNVYLSSQAWLTACQSFRLSN